MRLIMYINKNIIIFVLCLFAFLLCNCSDAVQKKEYTIAGHIKGVPDDTKLYLFNMRTQVNMDSVITKNERFIMKGTIDIPTQCVIMIPNSQKYADLIVENTEINLESTYEDMYFQNVVTGGYEQKLKNNLGQINGGYNRKYMEISDSLSRKLFKDTLHEKELRKQFNYNLEKSKTLMRAFILEHPNSYFTLDLLYRNRQYISRKDLTRVLKDLETKYKDTENALAIERFLNMGEVTIRGQFVDFEVNTLNDVPFKLSSLKGNYIYLSFWSTNCGPCRKENKFFSKNFGTLPKDLKLVSFSTDRTKTQWAKASKEDDVKWTNLSDLQGNNGRIAMIYGVQALPTSFLIGKDGKIIKKFTGYDDDSFNKILETIATEEGR